MTNQPATARRGHLCVAILLVIVAGSLWLPPAGASYTGVLVSTDMGLMATGNWLHGGETRIEWNVYQNPDDSWHYAYLFSHPVGETSHFILETSADFTGGDIFNPEGDFETYDVEWQAANPGSPYIPEALYGIRFNEMTGLASAIEFDSWRVPVWGDFYSKNGAAGGYGHSAAWNAGFTQSDWDPDLPAQNGSIENHILVPDTELSVVPEPSSLLLLGGAVGGALILRRRLG